MLTLPISTWEANGLLKTADNCWVFFYFCIKWRMAPFPLSWIADLVSHPPNAWMKSKRWSAVSLNMEVASVMLSFFSCLPPLIVYSDLTSMFAISSFQWCSSIIMRSKWQRLQRGSCSIKRIKSIVLYRTSLVKSQQNSSWSVKVKFNQSNKTFSPPDAINDSRSRAKYSKKKL